MTARPLALLLAARMLLVRATASVRVRGPGARWKGPAVYVNWHRHAPFMILHHGLYHRWLMVSPEPYMESIARLCRILGLQIERGATGLGGRAALKALARRLREGGSVVLAVDGPAGPPFQVKDGCVDLALATGAPLIPVAYSCRHGRTLEWRWDRMLVPRPFDSIEVVYGPPIRAKGTKRALLRQVALALVALDRRTTRRHA